MSRTYLATLQFDGTGFVGWQRQPAGRSVQVEFERVLERLFGRRTVAHAAGRTDAGVHAEGLGVCFPAPITWNAESLRRALNALLPRDCWVAEVRPMQPGFHARKSALSRRYRYDIGTDDAAASPFRRTFEWALGRPLDSPRCGRRPSWCSASTISAPSPQKGSRNRTTAAASRSPSGSHVSAGRGYSYHDQADRFLHHMVRMLVGTMVDIGLGRRPLTDIEALLERGDNQETSPPAPPQGLYFVAAAYPAELYADEQKERHAVARES